MSNFDRAVKALNGADEVFGSRAGMRWYVTALEAAGLLATGLPELAETIAGMEWEYQCQRLLPGTPEDWYTWLTTGSLESAKRHTEKHAAKMRARGYDLPSYRIRRRLAGDWEVINE